MRYTPLSELPYPPAFMLEELDREERAYNTELMARILTIPTAKPIRLELRKKFNTHPVAKEFNKLRAKLIIENWIKSGSYSMSSDNFIKTLPKDELEKLKNQTGKNKGQLNQRRFDLAQEIVWKWRHFNRVLTDYKERCLRLGFLKFYRYNMEQNNWGKDKIEDWFVQLPSVYNTPYWFIN